MAITAVTAIEFVSAAPEVTDITAKQRYPWNGLVDIGCKVSGIEGTINGYTFVVVAVDKDSGKEYAATHCTVEKGGTGVSGWEVSGNGDYALLWDARADMGQVVIERMVMRVTLAVPELSAGKVQLWEGGPYWADRNVGADKPWDYGLYFWWGDTTGHRPTGTKFGFNFDYENSVIYTCACKDELPKLDSASWVTELKSASWVTSSGVLASAHDAAHVKWGGSWRMPTKQELFDLCYNKCDWTWTTTRNGVNGYLVRGRGAYADRSIFLPAAGYGDWTSLESSGSDCYYWSSELNSNYYCCAYGFSYNSRRHGVATVLCYCGRPIRPVQ